MRKMDRPKTEKWGISTDLKSLSGGKRNHTVRTDGLEAEVVFKSTTRSPAAIAWLIDVHKRAREVGFIVPKFLESGDGNLVEDGWTCEQFIRGQPLSRDELHRIHRQILEFHSAAANLEQRPGFLSVVDLLTNRTGGDVNLNAMPRDLVERCRSAWSAVSDRQTAIVHGDLNSGNVIMTEDERYALIDWDESRRDLALFDLGQLAAIDEAGRRAHLAFEVACSWLVEPEYAQNVARRL